MPRPTIPGVTVSTHAAPAVHSPIGHVVTVYADKAVFDETAGKFIRAEDVDRN